LLERLFPHLGKNIGKLPGHEALNFGREREREEKIDKKE